MTIHETKFTADSFDSRKLIVVVVHVRLLVTFGCSLLMAVVQVRSEARAKRRRKSHVKRFVYEPVFSCINTA